MPPKWESAVFRGKVRNGEESFSLIELARQGPCWEDVSEKYCLLLQIGDSLLSWGTAVDEGESGRG